MVESHRLSGATYRVQLADVVQRAGALEQHARETHRALAPHNPERAAWIRIERRYATIRGNAQHLLLIYDWQRSRQRPFGRLRRYLQLG